MINAHAYRTLLFVPGSQPERFPKALNSGADCIIIDLEDAVSPEHKNTARKDAISWLASNTSQVDAGLRINSPRTPDGCADLAALANSTANPAFIMVPKTQTKVDLEIAGEASGCPRLIAIIECGRGLHSASSVASLSTYGVLFGGVDFSASLGADLNDWDALLHARGTIAAACGAASIPAFDVPFVDVKDEDQLVETSKRSRRMGFSGRACIHPSQINAVSNVYSPSAKELENAKSVIAALQSANGGVVLYQGKMVDRPVILAAQRVLASQRS